MCSRKPKRTPAAPSSTVVSISARRWPSKSCTRQSLFQRSAHRLHLQSGPRPPRAPARASVQTWRQCGVLTSLVTLLRVRSRNRVASRYWASVPGRSWRCGASTADEPRWQLPPRRARRDLSRTEPQQATLAPAGRDSSWASLDALGAPMHVTGQTLPAH